jgi:hypothetical protein
MNLAAGTPLWPSELTAWGTFALAAVTVAAIITTIVITRQDRIRTDRQLADERSAADKRLADEIQAADERLRTQIEQSDEQLRQEREAADARLQEERQHTQDREQRIEAYAVQVFNGMTSVNEVHGQSDPDDPSACPLAVVVNGGHYTISDIGARFFTRSATYKVFKIFHASAFYKLPKILLAGEEGKSESQEWPGESTVLTPSDPGLRIIGLARHVRELIDSYPVVRWTDRWGTRWEHKQGEVRQIGENEEWRP